MMPRPLEFSFAACLQNLYMDQLQLVSWRREVTRADSTLNLEVGTDNKGLFSCATATEVRIPSEPHLLYLLKALRDRLDAKAINALWWFDTRDMICDAMTKGSFSREPLLKLWRTAILSMLGESPVCWRSTAEATYADKDTAVPLPNGKL